MLDRVISVIEQQHLVAQGEPLLVGVSGGHDSVVLLDILVTLSKKRDNRLVVCHFDHQLRGVDSDEDARFVSQLAANYGLTHEIRSRDVRRFAREQKLSLEDAARIVACVNALAGIENPEEALKAVREALIACDGIVSAFGDPERHVKATVRRALALLSPA